MHGLRKISKDGRNNYNDFAWPLKVGSTVECPDWNHEPECGGGLHCLPNADGSWSLLEGDYWAVIEFDEFDMVMIDQSKCKVKKCKLVYLSESSDGLVQYFDHNKFNSRTAYNWAINIGNRDIMIDRVTESKWAYFWARWIGNQDVMIDRVTDSEGAYCWTLYIGNRDIMIDRITESEYAYYWAKYIGNRDIMIDRITESKWAYHWGRDIGNLDIMTDRITESRYAYFWARDIGNRDIMIARFPELKDKLCTA